MWSSAPRNSQALSCGGDRVTNKCCSRLGMPSHRTVLPLHGGEGEGTREEEGRGTGWEKKEGDGKPVRQKDFLLL